jgi:hypothetical protein
MNAELPPVIEGFFQSTNTRDFADFLLLFTDDAHVNDEANDYYGVQIADWIERATEEARPITNVTDIKRDNDHIVVTAQVCGNFPGSPVQLHYYFTLKDSKIATLLIKA